MIVLISFVFFNFNKKQKILRCAISYDESDIKRQIKNLEFNDFIMDKLYEGLIKTNEKGEPKEGIAESWEVNGNVWIFHLRKNAYWSDGSKINSNNFIESISKNLRNKENTKSKELTYYIKGAEEFENNIEQKISGIKALDDYTLEIELVKPLSYFPILLNNQIFAITNKEDTLSSGAFKIKSIDNKKIILEKNKKYWNNKNTKFDLIEIINFDEEKNILEKYEKKEIDIIFLDDKNYVFFNEHKDLKKNKPKNFNYIAINNESIYLNNKNLRKAVAYSVSTTDINYLYVSALDEKRTLINKKDKEDILEIEYNMKKAKNYMDLAMEEMGKNREELRVFRGYVPNTEKGQKEEIFLKDIFGKLGLKLKIESPSLFIKRQKINQGDYDIYIGKSKILYDDEIFYLELFFSKNREADIINFYNDRYDELIIKLREQIGKNEEILKEGEQILLDTMPVIPISFEWDYYLAKNELKNY
jgi:oligopeptide transport system substrate-binding protein